ncbi:MAG: transposase [Paracoccaceae bacterium]
MTYSQGFKSRMIERMAGPEGIRANALSKEVGICGSTLSRWLKSRSLSTMGQEEDEAKRGIRPASEKLRLVLEAASLSDADLGRFLRSEGLHEADLDEWRSAMMASLAPQKQASPKKSRKSPEAKRIAALERDLDRKSKALAEVTALLALKKRAEEIWGVEGEDTQEKSDS